MIKIDKIRIDLSLIWHQQNDAMFLMEANFRCNSWFASITYMHKTERFIKYAFVRTDLYTHNSMYVYVCMCEIFSLANSSVTIVDLLQLLLLLFLTHKTNMAACRRCVAVLSCSV